MKMRQGRRKTLDFSPAQGMNKQPEQWAYLDDLKGLGPYCVLLGARIEHPRWCLRADASLNNFCRVMAKARK